ncbi:MAG: redox-sensing transcriptional repressor Rex [Lachnospiraceae bacterium]|nr:redox-sensing transcriptional repressor Rex [Lachnospiraceae bacterium]
MDKEISPAVIKRMPRYYRYLEDLVAAKVERISSNELSEQMHVTASQIRQDLSNFGGFGQQGYGYNVKNLHDEIGRILGLDEMHNVIIIGAGNMGTAIANYVRFEDLSFKVTGIFDVASDKIGRTICGREVQSMDELPAFTEENHVDIAALTLPRDNAVAVADELISLGIKAIWNFAHVDLNVPEDVVVQNVHLSDSLMQLSFKIS